MMKPVVPTILHIMQNLYIHTKFRLPIGHILVTMPQLTFFKSRGTEH